MHVAITASEEQRSPIGFPDFFISVGAVVADSPEEHTTVSREALAVAVDLPADYMMAAALAATALFLV